jgi:hypothetical protein
VDYLAQTGSPTFTTAEAVSHGFINLANGNLHLEIPIASVSQRGSIGFTAKFVYDGRVWKIVNNGSSKSWQPTNVPNSTMGWRFVTTADAGAMTYNAANISCGGSNTYPQYTNFVWSAPDGTRHLFYLTTQKPGGCNAQDIPTAQGYAQDSSGYYLSLTSYTNATIYARDGTIVHADGQSAYTVKDNNGNYFSLDANGNVIDTVGRTVATYVTGSSCPAPANYCYNVTNSQNQTSQFQVFTETLSVSTSFGVSGVTEYSGSLSFIQKITLADGTSYSFGYDAIATPTPVYQGYGELTGITVPAGGTFGYGYTTFSDAYGNVNRWVNSRGIGSSQWTYTPAVISTCSPGSVGCQQKVTEAKPSGDTVIDTFTLNNGAWNVKQDSDSGTSTLLKTVATDFDFTNACSSPCFGAQYIRPTRKTITTPTVSSGNLYNKTEYGYDSAARGNVTQVSDWRYYTGSPSATADRTTTTAYQTITLNSGIGLSIYLPNDVTVTDASGTKYSETKTSYDSTSLTSLFFLILLEESY